MKYRVIPKKQPPQTIPEFPHLWEYPNLIVLMTGYSAKGGRREGTVVAVKNPEDLAERYKVGFHSEFWESYGNIFHGQIVLESD